MRHLGSGVCLSWPSCCYAVIATPAEWFPPAALQMFDTFMHDEEALLRAANAEWALVRRSFTARGTEPTQEPALHITEDGLVAGRHPDCQLVVDSTSVSPTSRHKSLCRVCGIPVIWASRHDGRRIASGEHRKLACCVLLPLPPVARVHVRLAACAWIAGEPDLRCLLWQHW